MVTSTNPAQTWLGAAWAGVVNVVTHEIWPFVETLFKTIALDNIKILAPLASEALGELEAELPVLLAGGVEGFLKAFNATVAGTVQRAEGLALQVTTTDILTASHAAVVNAQAKLQAVANK